MRRHPKASPAFTPGRDGSVAGHDARSFAPRGVFRDANGSGAPSHRKLGARFVALSFALALLVFAPPASASKTVHSFFGNPGSPPSGLDLNGGLFSNPRGVAVNVNGTGGAPIGSIYVANQGGNRIDQFTASGSFLRSFGRDVVEENKPNDNGDGFEICDITAGNVAADCKAGLNSAVTGGTHLGGTLSSPQGVAINQVTGNVYVTNQGLLRVEVFDATGHFIRAFGQDVVTSGAGNVTATAAKQTLTVDATEGQFKLTFRGQTSGDIAFNATAAAVDAALEAIPTVGTGNVAVTGGPGGAGGGTPYTITFSGQLNNAPMPLISASAGTAPLGGGSGASVVHTTTGSTLFEICNAIVDTCKTGVSASSAGAFKSTFNGHIAVSPVGAPNAGNVIVADPGNRRVNEYTATGAFVRSFGFDVTQSPPAFTEFEVCDASNFDVCKEAAASAVNVTGRFATNGPNRVAVDSTGAIYTVEQNLNFRVQKFTPSGGTLVPSIFAAGTVDGTSANDAPTDIAIGASNRVFVAKQTPAGAGTPVANQAERRVLELNSAGALLDTHAANAGLTLVNGLTANPTNGRLFLSSNSQPQRVYILGDAGPLFAEVQVQNIEPLSPTAVRLPVRVNSGGVLGTHRLEYVTDERFQIDGFASATVLPEESSGNSTINKNITRDLEELDPATLYHARLTVKQTFGTTSLTSSEVTFDTAPAKPTVAPFATADAGETTATLGSLLTANSKPTTYHFEWGTTTAYGNQTLPQDGGSGHESVLASAQITGLSPGTTYHFRLVASNASGTTRGEDQSFTTDTPPPGACPNAQFRTGPGASLPDCRAYEQVSPTDKNGGGVEWQFVSAGTQPPGARSVASDGDRAMFGSDTSFAGAVSGGTSQTTDYLAQRGANGWSTEFLFPRVKPAASGTKVEFSTPDLSRSLLSATGLLQIESPFENPGQTSNIYLRDNRTGAIDPLFGITTGSAPVMLGTASTPDLSHFAFASKGRLDAHPQAVVASTYEWADGDLRLVSVAPGGGVYGRAYPGGALAVEDQHSTLGAVSDDGRHVYFTGSASLNDPREIYRRTDGVVTASATPSKRIPADPAGFRSRVFRMATADGNRVLFTSSEALTNDAIVYADPFVRGDLYRYDFEADRMVDISALRSGQGEANVDGILGADDEAERVYYVARGQVLPGQGTPGEDNLYLWEDDGTPQGSTRFIASLLPFVNDENRGDSDNWRKLDGEWKARVSADGRYLLFESRAAIPGFDNGGVNQVYRYDAFGDEGAGELQCLSCNPGGEVPVGGAFVSPHSAVISTQRWDLPRNLLNDGRAFFTTQDDLLPQDTNEKLDAYLWDEGDLHLISTGSSSRDSYFYGASENGDDAFILTAEPLVPQDGDDLSDLYTAHVDGGFAGQFATPPPGCTGEECRGSGTEPDSGQPPLSGSFVGPVVVEEPLQCPKGTRKATATDGSVRCVKRCPKGTRTVKVKGGNGKVRCVKVKKKVRKNRASNDRRASR